MISHVFSTKTRPNNNSWLPEQMNYLIKTDICKKRKQNNGSFCRSDHIQIDSFS